MKYITIHPPQPAINLIDEPMKDEDDNDAVVSFKDFVAGRLADPSFGANVPAVLSACEIKQQLDKANGVLALENADYERLKMVTDTPSPQTPYNPQMSRSLVPFMKAIRDAADEAPEETEPARLSAEEPPGLLGRSGAFVGRLCRFFLPAESALLKR